MREGELHMTNINHATRTAIQMFLNELNADVVRTTRLRPTLAILTTPDPHGQADEADRQSDPEREEGFAITYPNGVYFMDADEDVLDELQALASTVQDWVIRELHHAWPAGDEAGPLHARVVHGVVAWTGTDALIPVGRLGAE